MFCMCFPIVSSSFEHVLHAFLYFFEGGGFEFLYFLGPRGPFLGPRALPMSHTYTRFHGVQAGRSSRHGSHHWIPAGCRSCSHGNHHEVPAGCRNPRGPGRAPRTPQGPSGPQAPPGPRALGPKLIQINTNIAN